MIPCGFRRLSAVLTLSVLLVAATGCAQPARPIRPAPDAPPPASAAAVSCPAGEGRENAPETPPAGPLGVTVDEAVLMSLQNNRSLVVERLAPAIRETFEDEERSVFDPVGTASLSVGRERGDGLASGGAVLQAFEADTTDGIVSLERLFPAGTRVALEAGAQMADDAFDAERLYAARFGLTVTQALLRGYGTAVNRARLHQVRLDTRSSTYELRAVTASLVADVERTYWDYALARRRIDIVEKSLAVARQQRDETETLIAVGRLARAELAAVQAEVAAQTQALIEAQAAKETLRLRLLRLINPAGADIWQREVEVVHPAVVTAGRCEEAAAHAALAARLRPVVNQARLAIQRGDLEVVRTRNGLLPVMDLFVTLGQSGYATSFGRSIERFDGSGYEALAGLRFEYPFANRKAAAAHRRAGLERDRAHRALENLLQLVAVDVRSAHIEVGRARDQIDASAATRRFDEEKLRIETEKLRVGKSTSFLVAQAQRDLLASRIAEVQALTAYLKSLVDLYLQDGSLLARRGIDAPGAEPVPEIGAARP